MLVSPVSCEAKPRLVKPLPGQDYMYPFGVIGVAPRYIPAARAETCVVQAAPRPATCAHATVRAIS